MKELLTTSNLNNGTLTLNFSDNLTAIDAGKPYIIKWTKAAGYDEADPETRDVKNPVFTGVTVSSTTPTPVTSNDNSVTFVGQYSPFTIDDSNINSVIMLGSGNKLGYSKNPRQLHSFRAHFEIPTVAGAPTMSSFVMNFGEGEQTGIIAVANSSLFTLHSSLSGWYTLDGRKLDGKPTKKGMYIVNGRKVVIK